MVRDKIEFPYLLLFNSYDSHIPSPYQGSSLPHVMKFPASRSCFSSHTEHHPKYRQTPYHTSRQGHRPSHKRLCLIAPYFDVIVSSSTKTGVLFPKYIVQDSVHQFFIRFVGIWKPTFGCGKKKFRSFTKKRTIQRHN